MAVMASGKWMSTAQVVAGLDERFGKNAPQILSQKTQAGILLRRGEFRRYEYRLNPSPPPARKRGRRATRARALPPPPAPKPAAEVHVPATMPAQHVPPASLGLVCASTAPANPAQGRIEDALASVLSGGPLLLEDILAALPAGWSRADAIGALGEAVIDRWIVGQGPRDNVRYCLLGAPPPPRADPLADRFQITRARARVEQIDSELAALICDVELHLPAISRKALISARSYARIAIQHIDR